MKMERSAIHSSMVVFGHVGMLLVTVFALKLLNQLDSASLFLSHSSSRSSLVHRRKTSTTSP